MDGADFLTSIDDPRRGDRANLRLGKYGHHHHNHDGSDSLPWHDHWGIKYQVQQEIAPTGCFFNADFKKG